MTTEANKSAIQRFFAELYGKHSLAVVDEMLAPGYVYHLPDRDISGVEAAKGNSTTIFENMPDFAATIEDIVAEGDQVWTRNVVTGTDREGVKATAATVNIFRFSNGKIAERWSIQQRL